MPKHKFDGRWNYFEIPHDGEPNVPTDGPDMILDIPEEDGDVNAEKSKHNNLRVDGNASLRTLDLVRQGPGNHTRVLRGKVVAESVENGERHITIVGTFVDDPDERSAAAQNEGTWVISKP